MTPSIMPAAPPDPSRLGDNQNDGAAESTSSSSPNSGSTGATSGTAGRDTKVFGNLEGRDPDLLFAGEKIMINGKEVTVADGDTLSSLAAKHGTTVDALIKENKMDDSLRGQNGPNGAYFTPGGPQPAPGGVQATPPDALAPLGPNGTYTKEQVPALRAEVERLQKDGTLAPDKATQLLGLLQKVENGGTLTAQEATDLTSLMKDLKTAQGSGTPSGVPASQDGQIAIDPNVQKVIQTKITTDTEKAVGIINGAMDGQRAKGMINTIADGTNAGNWSKAELDKLVDILNRAPGKNNGEGLAPEEKYLINKYTLDNRLYGNK